LSIAVSIHPTSPKKTTPQKSPVSFDHRGFIWMFSINSTSPKRSDLMKNQWSQIYCIVSINSTSPKRSDMGLRIGSDRPTNVSINSTSPKRSDRKLL